MKGISRCIIHSLKRTMKNLTQNYFYLSRIHGLDSLSLLQGHPPNPGIEPRSPTLQADSLPVEPPEKPRDNSSVQFSSVQSLSRVRLFADPMNHSTPGFPVHHQLPEFTKTHVHRVSDAIQPLIGIV